MNMVTNAFSHKLPEFWVSSALAWFAQAEAQFVFQEITADDTKYYLVSALRSSRETRMASFLKHHPTEDKYEMLKAHLLKSFELSDAEWASRLFTLQGLGNCKMVELMERMLDLMGEHKLDFLLLQLLLQPLPSQVWAALANTTITDCQALAKEADKFSQQDNNMVWLRCAGAGPPRQQSIIGLCFYHAKFGPKGKWCDENPTSINSGCPGQWMPPPPRPSLAWIFYAPMDCWWMSKTAVSSMLPPSVRMHSVEQTPSGCLACSEFLPLLAKFPDLTQPTFLSSATKLGFGLKNAAQIFQHLMNSVLKDLPFLSIYLDIILVASTSKAEHMSNLWTLIERLGQHGLIVNPAKGQLRLSTIDFLGYRFIKEGAAPRPLPRFPTLLLSAGGST
eukprot:superscaffoldBa00006845_g21950